MAKIVFKWAALCSECDAKIGLKPGQKMPEECPACHVKFEVDKSGQIVHREDETTLLHE